MSFLNELAQKGVIDELSVSAFEKEAQTTGKSIEDVVRAHGVLPEEVLLAKGVHFGLPTKAITAPISFEILKYIPEESAQHYQIAPLSVTDGALEVGIVDPDNTEARDALQFIASKIDMPFKLFLISQSDFEGILKNYEGLTGEVTKALTDLETELSDEEEELSRKLQEAGKKGKDGSETALVEDAPVTKIVATILKHAIEGDASDIHIEPTAENVRVRFRVDGALSTNLVLPLSVHSAIVARIKILCNMKLDERRKPQDNRFSARISGRKIDFRVSTFPAYYGEKVVLRILDSEKGVLPLSQIGFSERNLKIIRNAITRPYGLILISGPTGSGKTTTLYSMLQEVDRETQNVLSLEDPVEYSIAGMNQSQVRPEIGYTFASGLRTTLRQDPDIIMVGEIRDKETAQLAIQAALTGHLVFSTIHTNNAIGAIPRLIDMGVDPFLIGPTLILTMAQRLVRKLCPDTGKKMPMEGGLQAMFDRQFADLPKEYRSEIPTSTDLYGLEPTDDCPNGTRGRVAVFEVAEMTKELEHIILTDPVEPKLFTAARAHGMITMREDALMKSMRKEVPFEEVNTLGGLYDTADETFSVENVKEQDTPVV
ncbi:MAG: GspE/PulE family protein [Candidatus Campbellbacteria bacterium]|nr:GspE/PulE family protein [Candidatus Campbellbacteria bacterium]